MSSLFKFIAGWLSSHLEAPLMNHLASWRWLDTSGLRADWKNQLSENSMVLMLLRLKESLKQGRLKCAE